MKRTLVLMMVSLILLACGEKSNAVTVKEQSGQVKDFVEVLYFHGKQRCVTCRSIEQNTKELLESKFQRQMKVGKVVYRVIDISKKENARIAEKYEEGECPDSGEIRGNVVVVIPCSAQKWQGEG